MPINTSRYRRSVEWDGPKKVTKKPVFTDASQWRSRFYILLIAAIIIIVLLGGALGYVLWRNRTPHAKTNTTQTTDTSDISSWKKSENTTVGLTFLYPPDWKLITNKTQTDLDLLNVQISGSGTNGASSTVKIDVIKDASNLSLADWVKQFGPKDIKTEDSKIAGENALLAKFSNGETGEEQNVYYVLKNSNVYVFDLYQSAKDDKLQKELKDLANNVSFVSESTTETNTTPPPTNNSATELLLVNSVVSSFNDEFSTFSSDGTGKTLALSDKDETVYLKGSADVYGTNGGFHVLVGYFGKQGSTSKDGIYATEWDNGKKLTQIVSGVQPGLVRVARGGAAIAYLDGAKGVSKKIVVVDATGKNLDTINASKAIQYFAVSPDGLKVAYVTVGSSKINIATRDNDVARTLSGFTTSTIYAFDWDEIGESGDAFVYIADGSKLTNKAEMYFVTSEGKNNIQDATPKQLTTDSVAQDNPRFNIDATKIAYQAYTSGASGKSSVWVMGVDGKNDTNIVKSGSNLVAGWISK